MNIFIFFHSGFHSKGINLWQKRKQTTLLQVFMYLYFWIFVTNQMIQLYDEKLRIENSLITKYKPGVCVLSFIICCFSILEHVTFFLLFELLQFKPKYQNNCLIYQYFLFCLFFRLIPFFHFVRCHCFSIVFVFIIIPCSLFIEWRHKIYQWKVNKHATKHNI